MNTNTIKEFKPMLFHKDIDFDTRIDYYNKQIMLYTNMLNIIVIRELNRINYGIHCLQRMTTPKSLPNDIILRIVEFLPNDTLLQILRVIDENILSKL